ncbi:hypothetical protein CEXT_33141 [Caerostris extrusa]|uniref:Uncharacterized protein n=1 Tax=Caerostris extrusa TaxID=172846 RepID=A0AAV4XST2_CAEEX|nr:hypothetical protein CEXT_33141 [Caerostris extrusa]
MERYDQPITETDDVYTSVVKSDDEPPRRQPSHSIFGYFLNENSCMGFFISMMSSAPQPLRTGYAETFQTYLMPRTDSDSPMLTFLPRGRCAITSATNPHLLLQEEEVDHPCTSPPF